MGWKKQPSWLKGGIIVLVIGLIIISIGSYCGVNFLGAGYPPKICKNSFVNIISVFYLISAIPVVFFAEGLELINSDFYPILLISQMSVYFIIGAIIGWIFGKIKFKK